MVLPVINAIVQIYNPLFDHTDPSSHFQIYAARQVEVVQLNLNSGGMRVRFNDSYLGKVKVVTQDIDINVFFEQYQIVKK